MSTLTDDSLRALGLAPETIYEHQARIKSAIEGKHQQFIPVIDTCNLINRHIVSISKLNLERHNSKGFVAMVPAAGAASRYFSCLQSFTAAVKAKDAAAIEEQLAILRSQEAAEWAIPELLAKALEEDAQFSIKNADELIRKIKLPKALQPCNPERESFLNVKIKEHTNVSALEGQVFITPVNYAQEFESHAQMTEFPTQWLEQGLCLSTIRFNADGTPYFNSQQQVSPVPAGHGTLTRLFPKIKEFFPNCHSTFIRNIDNITGTSEEVINHIEQFLSFHSVILESVQRIRTSISKQLWSEASCIATDLIETLQLQDVSQEAIKEKITQTELLPLFQLQYALFHLDPNCMSMFDSKNAYELIEALFLRPVNTLGQVPNNGTDVGGSPVIAQIGPMQASICLELPHASPEHRTQYLENPNKATHFNPVVVAAELLSNSDCYENDISDLWILAKKQFEGHQVLYHETVLYELLGNSVLANVTFPEIPRLLFNPHKKVEDTHANCAEILKVKTS